MPVAPVVAFGPVRPSIQVADIVSRRSLAGDLAVQGGRISDLPSVPGDGPLSEPVKVVRQVTRIDGHAGSRRCIGIRVGDLDGPPTERQEEPRIITQCGSVGVIEALGDPGVLVQDPVSLHLKDHSQSSSVGRRTVVDGILGVSVEIVLQDSPHSIRIGTFKHVLEPRE